MTPDYINKSIAPYKVQLLNHPLYKNIKTVEQLNLFLEYHVFAVWDFMSLLKSLQNKLTCTSIPWTPIGSPSTRYLINEIVVAEETDISINGERQSHFEMYLEAMEATRANTAPINDLLNTIDSTKNVFTAITNSNLPEGIVTFLNFTFNIAFYGKPHEIAAAFTFGREDLIPKMFTKLLKELQTNFPEKDLSKLVYYFERHIELDADEHGPMAMQMINELCENDSKKWEEVETISIKALQKRISLWNAINDHIMQMDLTTI
ncbi:DUF3050 domain-containing protein [Pontimicrobium sp. MEBiC06410]